jgi:hypothetical protein
MSYGDKQKERLGTTLVDWKDRDKSCGVIWFLSEKSTTF